MRRKIRVFGICLLIAIGLKFIIGCSTPTDGGYGIEDDYTGSVRIDDELKPYLTEFLQVARAHHGIDVSHVYKQDVTIIFTDTDNGNVATSYGRNKDKIIVVVNRERFYNRTEQGRQYVMFHEFGHDILNLPHAPKKSELGKLNPMMRPTSYSGFFKEGVDGARQSLYLYESLEKMFNYYKSLDEKANN